MNRQQKTTRVLFIIFSACLIFFVGLLLGTYKETIKKYMGFATVYDFYGSKAVTYDWETQANSFAWGENIGWVDFSSTVENPVYIADNALWGYGYGENIGWVSLNCGNTSSCDSVDYKVTNDGEGNLSGYAWGENIGWIDFGTSTGSYQVTIGSDGVFDGYAWGENIGWINFSSTSYNNLTTTWRPQSTRPECNNGLDDDTDGNIDYPDDTHCTDALDNNEEYTGGTTRYPPTVSLSASHTSVTFGSSTILTWTSTYSNTCVAGGGWSGDIDTNGSTSTGALSATTTFSITCTGTYGTANASVIVGVSSANITIIMDNTPAAILSAFPMSTTTGGSSILIWSSTNATSCIATGGWSGILSTGGSTSTGMLSATTTYYLSCSGVGGTASTSVIVGVVAVPAIAPTVSLLANPTATTTGGISLLTWSSTDVTTCTASGGWSGTKATSGSAYTDEINATTTYMLSCTGVGGTASSSVTVRLLGPVIPECTVDVWECNDWVPSLCPVNETQERTCYKTFDCSTVVTGSPTTTKICVYNPEITCTKDDWTYGPWSGCINSVQTRTATKVFDCAGVDTASDELSRSCSNNNGGGDVGDNGGGGGNGGGGSNDTATTTSTSTASIIIENITENIQKTIDETVVIAKETVKQVDEIVSSPTGSVVTKSVSTAGVVTSAAVSVSAIAFANPITLAEIWLIPMRLFGLILSALGLKRKLRPWGTVYDSVTKRPLDPVYVSLVNLNTKREVASAITDLDGRYGFLVLPGVYQVVPRKTNYIYPSNKIAGKTYDEVYNDLYFGETITVEKEGEIITKNIPMDSQSFDWNEFAKNKSNINTFIKKKDVTWARISRVLFWFGTFASLLGLVFAPEPYNLIIACLYVVAYILNFFVFKTKKAGTLFEKNTNIPLSFAIVKIFREGSETEMVKKIADKYGEYYCLVPNGKYFLKIDKKNNDGSYSNIHTTDVVEITKGIINLDLKI